MTILSEIQIHNKIQTAVKFKMNEIVDLKEVQSDDAALTVVDIFAETVLDQKGLKAKVAADFFAQCLANLENPSSSPKSKFYTVFMLRELSFKQNLTRKLFGPFSKHQLYAYLEDTALNVDPKKAVQEKGKNLFPSDKKTGNNFMRLILESLLTWSLRFGNNPDKPTRFTQTLEKINKSKIVVPNTFIYYQKKGQKPVETPSGEPKQQQAKKPVPVSTPQEQYSSAPKIKQSKDKYASQIKFMANKIQTLLSIIQDTDQPQQLERQVNSYHQKFAKDYEKLQAQQVQMIDGQPQNIIGLYFKVIQFFDQEKGLYQRHVVSNSDYASYISGYTIAYEKMFQESKMKKQSSRPPKEEPSIDSKLKASVPTSKTIQKIAKEATKESKTQISSSKLRKAQSRTYQRQSRLGDATKAVDNFFSKLQTNSKSPHQGYSNLAKSMSREKQSAIAPRKKHPLAVSNFNKSRFGANSAAKSTVNMKGIFAAPPNPNVRSRNYQGELVLPQSEMQSARQSVLRMQGHRRFKASHFKNKYVLFEDEFIQIGFKISQVYQKVDKFSAMMMFQLYFGNKREKALKNLTLHFQGDKQSLIYTTPQQIDSIIMPQAQIKLQLLNVPKRIPFGHIQIQLSYDFQWQTRRVSAYLPNSILQMVTYYSIQPHTYATQWADCVKILKTQAFILSHYFPPNELKHLIPNLNERTSYQDFSTEGSIIDYQLFTEVIIQESYQGILKINVRPDLTVVLQAGIIQSQENCIRNFRAYLQSMEMLLKKDFGR